MSALYTPAMLAAAVELAQYPVLPAPCAEGRARSTTCGSEVTVQLALAEDGLIARIGLQARACAVGQAAAAVFARHAPGRSESAIAAAHDALAGWLAGEGAQPDWPDLDLVAPALDYPARHGAMLLPWKAAREALSSVPASR
ncbi:iron-sulfur cluster assembly scaffold protein [Erythrobacter sp. EC-HK427]|uniref:iron-sulfur cluster assembly scaffold protein n=1 Tax=Erythrobacter sp. EC-HK427 TaxID=2038396 RepID=UPI0012542DCB|nr:iron-sulfur cluster assembly scaffold protein [Erythrobacter sp. EC-HK427]VVT15707.1 Fe-S cluster protein [Erythrobacter sp. EC-HK427]